MVVLVPVISIQYSRLIFFCCISCGEITLPKYSIMKSSFLTDSHRRRPFPFPWQLIFFTSRRAAHRLFNNNRLYVQFLPFSQLCMHSIMEHGYVTPSSTTFDGARGNGGMFPSFNSRNLRISESWAAIVLVAKEGDILATNRRRRIFLTGCIVLRCSFRMNCMISFFKGSSELLRGVFQR